MSNSVSEEQTVVKELINEGKYEEALQCVKDIEKRENPTTKETLRTKAHKGRIYFDLGQHELALKNAEDLYQKSREKLIFIL